LSSFSQEIDVTSTYRRAAGVVWRRSQQTVLLLSVPGRDVLALNGAGGVLWQLLSEPASLEQLAGCLSEVYGADTNVIARDLEPVLAELVDRKVLELVAAA
jgi:hypothetical protein